MTAASGDAERMFLGRNRRCYIEAENMTILEKEFRNGNFALSTCHFNGGGGWGLPVRHKVRPLSTMERLMRIRRSHA